MQQKEKVYWNCLVGGASKWKPGQVLEKKIKNSSVPVREITLQARYAGKLTDAFLIEISWSPGELSFAEILHQAGAIPLPPYIKREVEASDAERYQTIYAREKGSVAAPTAGLHFTAEVMADLKKNHIRTGFVTLHVGAGTFKPVKVAVLADHEMHGEWIDVKRETIESLLENLTGKIIAVGTTSLRTLETLYWIGKKLLANNASHMISPVEQWEPYENNPTEVNAMQSLQAIIDWMEKNKKDRLVTQTHILIAPGYRFRIVNGLITNFHQPQSTLLLLIAAFVGNDWRKIYDYAMEHDFRFLSYGDGCLMLDA